VPVQPASYQGHPASEHRNPVPSAACGLSDGADSPLIPSRYALAVFISFRLLLTRIVGQPVDDCLIDLIDWYHDSKP